MNIKKEVKALGYWWYQPMQYGDYRVPCKYDGVQHKDSYGLGKFNYYIKPLLNQIPNRFKFYEMGTNAGQFLIEAHKMGFQHIYGIEEQDGFYPQLEFTKKFYPEANLNIRKDLLDGNFDTDNEPMVDVLLMSNLHYWIPDPVLAIYLKKLQQKAIYIIIVSSNSKDNRTGVIKKFKDWELLNTITTKFKGKGVRSLTSYLFKNKNLYSLNTVDEFNTMVNLSERHDKEFNNYFKVFCERALAGKVNDVHDEELYKALTTVGMIDHVKRGPNAHKRPMNWKKFILDIRDNGQKSPITQRKFLVPNKDPKDLKDGHHRLAMLHYLKIPYIYARKES